MIIMAFFYFIVLIGAVIFYVMYKDDLSFYLLLSILTLIPILLTTLILTRRKLKVSLVCKNDICRQNKECPLILRIKNDSIFTVSSLKIKISYSNALEGTKSYVLINTPAHFKNTDEICLKLSSEYCGRIDACIEKIRIYDLFRLFSMKLKPEKKEASFYVMPSITATEPSVINYSNPLSESPSYSKHRPGDDPSEIFGLHEYVPGDRISKVHWKVSAKEDKLIVKDYSLPLGNNVAIFICVSNNQKHSSHKVLSDYNKAVSISASLGAYLSENEISHTVYIMSDDEGLMVHTIDSEESYKMFLMSCVSKKIHSGSELLAYSDYIARCEEATASRYSHCIIICPGETEGIEQTLISGCELCHRQTLILTSAVTTPLTRLPENTQFITLSTDNLSALSDIII